MPARAASLQHAAGDLRSEGAGALLQSPAGPPDLGGRPGRPVAEPSARDGMDAPAACADRVLGGERRLRHVAFGRGSSRCPGPDRKPRNEDLPAHLVRHRPSAAVGEGSPGAGADRRAQHDARRPISPRACCRCPGHGRRFLRARNWLELERAGAADGLTATWHSEVDGERLAARLSIAPANER